MLLRGKNGLSRISKHLSKMSLAVRSWQCPSYTHFLEIINSKHFFDMERLYLKVYQIRYHSFIKALQNLVGNVISMKDSVPDNQVCREVGS